MAYGNNILDRNSPDRRKKPIGNLSAKLPNGKWEQVASIFFNKGKTGAYLMVRVKLPFTAKEGDTLSMFLNSSDYRMALIKRGTIIV